MITEKPACVGPAFPKGKKGDGSRLLKKWSSAKKRKILRCLNVSISKKWALETILEAYFFMTILMF